MTSIWQPSKEYVFIIIRSIFSNEVTVPPITLLCHYGETNDVYPIGGEVLNGETHIATVLRYLHELAGLRLASEFPIHLINV